MAHSIDITIPQPALLSGQHFHVRYHTVPNGIWVDLGNETNATFTITGLADGDYELEVTVIEQDGTACPSVIYDFSLSTPSCGCITDLVGSVQQVSANQYQIMLTFGLPGTLPPCGWIVRINNPNNTTTTASYPVLHSPLVIPVAVNAGYYVTIIADCCQKNQVECASVDISKAVGTTCTAATFGAHENQKQILFNNGQYYLKVVCTAQSNPQTPNFFFTYVQDNVQAPWPGNPNPGPADAGTYSGAVGGSPLQILIPIHPNTNVTTMPYSYTVTAVDVCGNKILVG